MRVFERDQTADNPVIYVIYSRFALVRYDSTGMFHWTPARAIEDCVIVSKYLKILLWIPWKQLNLL